MEGLDFKVKKKNLYETAADRMEDIILSNSLRQRGRLPNERELILRFGISCNIMRESLELLRERQLIVQENGEGTFIARPESESVTGILNCMLRLDNIGYMDMYEMCKLLEPCASRVMVEKKDDLDSEKLERCLQGIIESKDVQGKRIDYDIQFHICVAKAVGNSLPICFINSMMSLQRTILLRGIVTQQERHQDGIEFHKKIIDSLGRGDPDETEAAMRAHIEESAGMY